MKLWDEYISYIKDNPEGYWFKSKLYGYGWTPAKPAGWAVIGVYILFLLGFVMYAEQSGAFYEDPKKAVGVIVGATLLLIVISWKTGEPLKWQWGRNDNKH